MKVLYSQLQKYLPNLTASPEEVTNAYTLTGFMLDKYFEVKYQNKDDHFFDLEVRQNRADAFGVKGLARELSAYFNVPLAFPNFELPQSSATYELPIEVKARDAVKRVMAVKINNIEIKESPAWLKEYLALYEINSINNLVDLTNYVMLETAHSSHAFDVDLMGSDKLVWEINPSYKKFTTLSGEEVDLVPEALVISNGEKPLCLCLIGGKEVAINPNTKNIILEMAIYDGGLVRRNSRQMKIITEAGQRLEKYLDPESIPEAFAMLLNLIKENCGGEIASKIYDNYIQPTAFEEIKVDLDKVQQVAGIEISYEESVNYLERLGFQILKQENNLVYVKRPKDRLDVELEEDVFEEIIRMKGYNIIPKEVLSSTLVKNITPSKVTLINNIENILSSRGFDEVRSWVLVDSDSNQKANSLDWGEIQVTNSINEEVPFLRQSITVSILDKFNKYKKNNVPDIKIFENGKIFGKVDSAEKYSEIDSLGMLIEGKNINNLKEEVEALLRSLGITEISYTKREKQTPTVAHPKTNWDIFFGDKNLGIIYVTNSEVVAEASICEINVSELDKILNELKVNHRASEVTQKLVGLDENIELENLQDIIKLMNSKLYGNENIWKWEVLDSFKLGENKTRYTVRVYYLNLTDTEAKDLHKKIFSL